MAKSKKQVGKRLDAELVGEITNCVIDRLREEETRLVKSRHDRKRANIKLALRKYREIVTHVDKAVYKASQVEDDFTLQELLEMMSGNSRESFRVESIRESAAKAKIMVDHMDMMLETYRLSCENSNKAEEKRRWRVLYSMYIGPERKTPEEIAQDEFVDKSTIYRDIDAAADRLAVLFFGVYGLKFF